MDNLALRSEDCCVRVANLSRPEVGIPEKAQRGTGCGDKMHCSHPHLHLILSLTRHIYNPSDKPLPGMWRSKRPATVQHVSAAIGPSRAAGVRCKCRSLRDRALRAIRAWQGRLFSIVCGDPMGFGDPIGCGAAMCAGDARSLGEAR